MKIGFFGGTGFFGSSIVRFINSSKYREKSVFFIGRTPKENIISNFLHCDVSEKTKFPENIKFDVVIHGVSDSTDTSKTLDYQKIEKALESTINIAHFCKRTAVKKIVYLSSGAVYGPYLVPRKEDFETKLNLLSHENHYALGKISSETYLKAFCNHHNLKLNIVRPFAFGGKDFPRTSHYAIGNFVDDAANGRDLLIKGNGKDIRSYMHQDDMVKFLFAIIDDKRDFTIHNLGSEKKIDIKELAEKVIELCGVKASINFSPSASKTYSTYLPDCNRLNNDFKIGDQLSLDKIIEDMLA